LTLAEIQEEDDKHDDHDGQGDAQFSPHRITSATNPRLLSAQARSRRRCAATPCTHIA
jgi:hypothetical protein